MHVGSLLRVKTSVLLLSAVGATMRLIFLYCLYLAKFVNLMQFHSLVCEYVCVCA